MMFRKLSDIYRPTLPQLAAIDQAHKSALELLALGRPLAEVVPLLRSLYQDAFVVHDWDQAQRVARLKTLDGTAKRVSQELSAMRRERRGLLRITNESALS